jgi:hypothetical protein
VAMNKYRGGLNGRATQEKVDVWAQRQLLVVDGVVVVGKRVIIPLF